MITLLIFKGFIIGIGKVIPGISGSVLAISMGIYDKIIYSFSGFFKEPKKNFVFLFQILIGISMAMIFGSKIIYYLISNFYIVTMFAILGFILGTIPSLIKKTNYNIENIIISVNAFLLTFALDYIKFNITINISTIILFGIIEAFTSIVPGISGTAIFINLGVYEYILYNIGNINLNFLLFYILGIIIGLVLFSKLISYFLDKHEDKFLSIVNGLVTASLISIFKICFSGELKQIIIGLIVLSFSTIISYLST